MSHGPSWNAARALVRAASRYRPGGVRQSPRRAVHRSRAESESRDPCGLGVICLAARSSARRQCLQRSAWKGCSQGHTREARSPQPRGRAGSDRVHANIEESFEGEEPGSYESCAAMLGAGLSRTNRCPSRSVQRASSWLRALPASSAGEKPSRDVRISFPRLVPEVPEPLCVRAAKPDVELLHRTRWNRFRRPTSLYESQQHMDAAGV